MKTFTLCVYVCAVLSLTSFKKIDTGETPNNLIYVALNQQAFAQSNALVNAQLVYKAALINGRAPAKTYIDINIVPGLTDSVSTDNLRFEINYCKDFSTTAPVYCVTMQYQGGNYFAVKEESELNINALTSYNGSLKLSANFNLVMRSYGYPADKREDLNITGRLDNISVAVPSWLAAKI